MATSQMSEVVQHLRRMVLLRDGAGLSDGQLLADYLSRRDEAALATLVRRHSPMVWGVCRRVLSDYHDAEDAFQATFLVLVRRAASIASPELLANWLYGVAHQTALKARVITAKRRARERQVVADMPELAIAERELWADLQPLLDQELSRLPAMYRAAIVLCDLGGMTRREAARQLGVPDGTLAARLARGRAMLAKRLARHGVVVSGGLLAAVVAQNTASASVPASVLNATIKATGLFAAGPAGAAGAISAKVSALTEGVLRSMFLTKAKVATAVLLVVGILGSGAGWLTQQALTGKPEDKSVVFKDAPDSEGSEVRCVVKAVDDSRNMIRVRLRKEAPGETSFHLVGGAKVLLDDGTGDRSAFQEGKLAEVAEGDSVTLRLTADRNVVRVWVEGSTVQGKLKAVDKANHTITATVAVTKGEAAGKTFVVAENAKLCFDDGLVPDKTQPLKQVGLGDLPLNAQVMLRLSADRKAVGCVRVEGPNIAGLLKAVDRDKSTITVTIPGKDGPDVDRTFVVVKTAPVSIADGRPAGKAKAADWLRAPDLPIGTHVTLKLSPDEQRVVAVDAEGPTVFGVLKGIDSANGTLTLDNKVRGAQTYRVMKDAVVFFDRKDKSGKLADLPVGAVVELKLLTDQQTVREIRAK